jgi:hypothetical protein
MALAYTRSANLRALSFKAGCPEAILNCQPFFEKLVNPQIRNTLITDMHTTLPMPLDDDDDESNVVWNDRTTKVLPEDLNARLSLLLPNCHFDRKAQFLQNIRINGLTYSTAAKHAGNSCILFKAREDPNVITPGRIIQIIQILVSDSVQTYIAVRQHAQFNGIDDPYAHFPVLKARLYEACLNDLQIISLDQIVSHFACLPIQHDGRDLVVVASLHRIL